MDLVLAVLAIGFAVVIVTAMVRLLFDRVTVHEYERGLRYSRGRLVGMLDAGTYLVFRPLGRIRVFDLRPSFVTIEGQEILTSDGVGLKVSAVARYVVGDPAAAVTGDQDFNRALYVTLQLGLRDALIGRMAEEVLAARGTLGPAVMDRCAASLAKMGIELLAVDVRDLMLPGELKRAFAGVVAARKEGEIALERARGETAALRNLANAARMVEDHPGLVQLRLLQELGSSSGNTIVVGMPDGATVVPRRAGRGGAPGTGSSGTPAASTDGGGRG